MHLRPLFLTANLGAIVSAILVPPPAAADIFRCAGADGQTIYTDNRANCPGSTSHEPKAAVQTIPGESEPAAAEPVPPPRRSDARSFDRERAQKAHWQQKKRMKEEELRVLEERTTRLARFVTACNRGSEIITRDATGIKHQVPCEQIRKEHAEAEALQKPIREYLESGLQRECRQAGCLPGWIR